jgi:hypothetical protein
MMRRLLPVVLAVVVAAAACGTPSRYADLKAPKSAEHESVTTSTVADLEKVTLPGVGGTTTTRPVAIGPGPATIVGRVDGPDGPVAGATVQLERFVGDRVATLRVPTAADGSWNAQGVLGGRYRIRAWLAPTLGMAAGLLTFVDSTKRTSVNLKLDSYEHTTIDAAIAPNPPVVGQPTNLAVRVRTRDVDGAGFVHDNPASGVTVTLTGSGSWSATSSGAAATGADGVARFELVCQASGSQPLTAQLADGTTQDLQLPACVDPPTA